MCFHTLCGIPMQWSPLRFALNRAAPLLNKVVAGKFRNRIEREMLARFDLAQYSLPTSGLLQDPSLAHRQAMSNSRKRSGTWQREFCGCGTFTAVRIYTAVVVQE